MSRNAFSVTVNIDAPPEKVFAVLCDVERWPEWTPTMTSVQRLDQGPFGVGSVARVRQPKLRPTVWKVTALEAQNFTWVTSAPGLRMQAGHAVERSRLGSRVELSFEISGFLGPVVALVYGGLIEEYVATESQKLKQRAESAAT
ncbi:MAG TPA: SRPBCC family protein [Steroidobacteraceae bacterium]|nr:SRPBCC family protein [Steroidobacteraceae bacterium]